MKIKIASWNVEGRLSNTRSKSRGSSLQIIKNIIAINADIFVLLEAHTEASLNTLKSCRQLTEMGYDLYNVPYEDDAPSRSDTYASQLSMMLLSRHQIKQFNIIRLGNLRNAFAATVELDSSKPFVVIGVHLDDRSEAMRLKQISDVSKVVNESKLPTIVMGDFNATHGEDLWPSKILRTKLAKLLAHIILPSISLRAIEMACGETLNKLETNTNLVDADTSHRPTTTPKMRNLEWLPSIPLIQIDHIFVPKNVKVESFNTSKDGGADHRAIIANLPIEDKRP